MRLCMHERDNDNDESERSQSHPFEHRLTLVFYEKYMLLKVEKYNTTKHYKKPCTKKEYQN